MAEPSWEDRSVVRSQFHCSSLGGALLSLGGALLVRDQPLLPLFKEPTHLSMGSTKMFFVGFHNDILCIQTTNNIEMVFSKSGQKSIPWSITFLVRLLLCVIIVSAKLSFNVCWYSRMLDCSLSLSPNLWQIYSLSIRESPKVWPKSLVDTFPYKAPRWHFPNRSCCCWDGGKHGGEPLLQVRW